MMLGLPTARQSGTSKHDAISVESLPPPPDLTRYIVKTDDQYSEGGSFADVYRCRYEDMDAEPREVAVKAFRFSPYEDEDKGNKLEKVVRRELGIWRRLDHANVVPFLGIAHGFGAMGTASLVSLWMPNNTLGKFLAKHEAKLNTSHRLQILFDIASGLEYLHSLPIIHGDLYPNNVLLDSNYAARLTDFGYASLTGSIVPSALAYLQRSTVAPGALRWNAPEQHSDDPETSGLMIESDIYSFACIGLQVLSGQEPWAEVRAVGRIMVLLYQGKNPGRPQSRAIDDSHWDFLQLCWSPPQNRPAAEKLVTFLKQFMEDSPPSGPLRDLFITPSNQVYLPRKSDSQEESAKKLDMLGDSAMSSKRYDEAIRYYSDALSLDPENVGDIIVKCCRARVGLFGDVLERANKEIEIDPLSYEGYKRKRAMLHQVGHHREAFEAFEVMFSKISQSPNPHVRLLRRRYVNVTPTIREIVQQTILHMPHTLINTRSGRLCDKTLLAAKFESLPIFHELRSSMITQVDGARILREVKRFYRYAMLSRTWESNEPLYQTVEGMSIYQLEASSANIRLKKFCTLARAFGFEWVWSDTCCINKKNNVTLQESLVAMFTWFRGSSLTIIHLLGVWSQSAIPGALRRSFWNTHTWAYPEYVAAETVQFYTEDWKPYLGLSMFNHKESPVIIDEMRQASGDFTQDLAVLQPDLEQVREKLYLASMRQTTIVEDIAYSLLGIFNVSIPVIYGEGDRAIGRLLEHVLTGSGDATILAWTGRSGSYNSCLPMDLAVYNSLAPPHVPQLIDTVRLNRVVMSLRPSLQNLSLALKLYQQLNELASPSFAGPRLRLPCITFPATKSVRRHILSANSDSNLNGYLLKAAAFRGIEIKTADDLSGMEKLMLVHPWIISLLHPRRAPGDQTSRALQLLAHLREPFGALLLGSPKDGQYRRVATDCLIMVQIRHDMSLAEVVDGVRMVEIQ